MTENLKNPNFTTSINSMDDLIKSIKSDIDWNNIKKLIIKDNFGVARGIVIKELTNSNLVEMISQKIAYKSIPIILDSCLDEVSSILKVKQSELRSTFDNELSVSEAIDTEVLTLQ